MKTPKENEPKHSYEFGPFSLDTRERVLMRDKNEIPLPPKVFDTLLLLVQNHGHVLGKEMILRELWPGTFVEDGSLTQSISQLRKVLCSGSNREGYIQTVPKHGYRFIAKVNEYKGRLHDTVTDTSTPVAEGSQHLITVPRRGIADRLREIFIRPVPLGWTTVPLIIAVALIWAIFRFSQPATETHTAQLQLNPPPGIDFRVGQGFAISPDGRTVAFVAGKSVDRLWVRNLDSASSQQLPETDGAMFPFWSPDQRSLGFFAGGKLKRIDLANNQSLTLADAPLPRGGAWGAGNAIIFGAAANGPLWRVSALGGTPQPATMIDASREATHRWPVFLPDGRTFLFYVRARDPNVNGVYLGLLDRPREKIRVVNSATDTLYSPRHGKHPSELLWAQEGSLITQPFDTASGRLLGQPAPVLHVGPVGFGPPQLGLFSVSQEGTLVFGREDQYQLTWYSREGKILGTIGGPAFYGAEIRISPDGRKVAVQRREGNFSPPKLWGSIHVWTIDLTDQTQTRINVGDGGNGLFWSPNGRRIVYGTIAENSNTRVNLFTKPANGVGPVERLTDTPHSEIGEDWSPDGKYVLYTETSSDAQFDLWILPLVGERKPAPLLPGQGQESQGRFSPDGRWISYTSDESGRQEVYVQSFPLSETKMQVSTDGGSYSVWRRDGKELFYCSPAGNLIAVPVRPFVGKLEFGPAKVLFPIPRTLDRPAYDVAADGQRFLTFVPSREAEASYLTVVLNWQANPNSRR
jgi:Tol biopolymer transport system component/DNA-binding winged helix-turn-helix (wHTH) protein